MRIDDDDPYVTINTPKTSFKEDATDVTFDVGLSAITHSDVTIPVATTYKIGTTTYYYGTARTDDYSVPSGTSVTIPAGQKSATVTLCVFEDDNLERDETVIFKLGTPTGATLGPEALKFRTFTIENDDGFRSPKLSRVPPTSRKATASPSNFHFPRPACSMRT